MSKQTRYLVEHLFEVRFQPYMPFLDRKATLGNTIRDNLNLDTLNVGADRIDIFPKDHLKHVFISYTNYGVSYCTPPTESSFIDLSRDFLNELDRNDDLFKLNPIVRLGVKSNFLFPFNAFEVLKDKIELKIFNLTENGLKCFKRVPVDIGINWNFLGKDKSRMNIQSGPMLSEQAKSFFSEPIHKILPKVGFFFLADTFYTEGLNHRKAEILDTLNTSVRDQIETFEKLVNLILE
jgi:hypothetical protein